MLQTVEEIWGRLETEWTKYILLEISTKWKAKYSTEGIKTTQGVELATIGITVISPVFCSYFHNFEFIN